MYTYILLTKFRLIMLIIVAQTILHAFEIRSVSLAHGFITINVRLIQKVRESIIF